MFYSIKFLPKNLVFGKKRRNFALAFGKEATEVAHETPAKSGRKVNEG